MNTLLLPSYVEQFNKITEAYIHGDIKPMDPNFCFCGVLAPKNTDWGSYTYVNEALGGEHPYTPTEYRNIELALLETIQYNFPGGNFSKELAFMINPPEEALFKSISAALDELKKIHEALIFTHRNVSAQV